MRSTRYALTPQMIAEFCLRRLGSVFSQSEVTTLRDYLILLLEAGIYPPYRGTRLAIDLMAKDAGIDSSRLMAARQHIRPIVEAVARAVAEAGLKGAKGNHPEKAKRERSTAPAKPKRKRGRAPKPVVEFPDALEPTWDEPEDFAAALRLHVSRHGETMWHLYSAIVRPEDGVHRRPRSSRAGIIEAPGD